ncbi:class E sortase [Streptomyces sp. NPDC093085]|uniref:class E sortase n=1 Tax=Streptomyces sp. NPDC093085 TaxID=3155068 RepID=UPI00341CC098
MSGLADPLTDPLPGTEPPEAPVRRPGRHRGPSRETPAPPAPVPPQGPVQPRPPAQPQSPVQAPLPPPAHPGPHPGPPPPAEPAPARIPRAASPAAPAEFATQPMPVIDLEAEPATAPAPAAVPRPRAPRAPELPPPAGGRAERRRAAKGGARGRRRGETATEPPEAPEAAGTPQEDGVRAPTGRPLSRMEARRAARAAKESPAVIASRAIGELFISVGVLMLLFVTYQLWWTNVAAGQFAGKEADKIQSSWAEGRKPDAFQPGQGFALMYIPKLDVVVPIAEGISKSKVLDNGMVGHYAEGSLKTAMPSDKQGNFAVAGHRNTHGEPFRYINRLQPGDKIVVETQDAYYTYDMTSILPQTPPSNVSVITPVPPGSGFTKPGRYITLTTCTPEFTSTYRMIVWGKMVDERPRSKGKPDALVG